MYEYKSANMSYAFDVEHFINEVKSHPVIWDINREDFKFKNKKQEAWEEVARVFIKDIDDLTKDEKWDVYKKLQGKWRNLRDSYVRNLKKKDGKSNYTYARNMAFLYHLYNDGPEKDSGGDNDEFLEEEISKKKKKKRGNAVKFEPEPDSESSESKKIKNEMEGPIPEFVDTPLLSDPSSNFPVGLEDEDRSFFESLLPAVREFDLDQKIEFRCAVLKLIKNLRSATQKVEVLDFDD